ncbi:MAG: hypothetical protein J5793_04290 [Clostridia bacterium]|nr:hypothetical protein [Clostridia bacterium]
MIFTELDAFDIKNGLEFIVGKWEPEFLVNAFSNDLAHIPASEFKSDDGTDFTALKFEFFEDHTVKMTDSSKDRVEEGTWEQTGFLSFRYTLNGFIDIPEGPFRDSAEKLEAHDGRLVFAIGFLAVALKKTEKGKITNTTNTKQKTALAPDREEKMKEIIGKYAVAKAFTDIDGEMGLYTLEAVKADLDKRVAAGEMEAEEAEELLSAFNMVIEITDDHRVVSWAKIPAGVSDEDIKEALEGGDILAVEGDMIAVSANEWKEEDGKILYNTEETRELFGEEQSPWDELAFDEEGFLPFGSGMMMLKKI